MEKVLFIQTNSAQPCMSNCLLGNLVQSNMALTLMDDPVANEAVFTVSITAPLVCLSGIVLENFFCLSSYLFFYKYHIKILSNMCHITC